MGYTFSEVPTLKEQVPWSEEGTAALYDRTTLKNSEISTADF